MRHRLVKVIPQITEEVRASNWAAGLAYALWPGMYRAPPGIK